jgi:hypothetical protein
MDLAESQTTNGTVTFRSVPRDGRRLLNVPKPTKCRPPTTQLAVAGSGRAALLTF